MSMQMCEGCEKWIDTDKFEMVTVDDKAYCENCANEMEAEAELESDAQQGK